LAYKINILSVKKASAVGAVLRDRLFQGASMSAFNCAVRMLAGIWLTPLLLRYLGVQGYGQWVLLLNILTFLYFFDAGIFPVLRNRMAGAAAKGNARAFRAYAFTSFVIGGCVSLVGLLAVAPALAITKWTLPELLNVKGGHAAVFGVVIFGALGTAFYCVDTILLSQLRFRLFRIGDLIANILYVVGTLLVVRWGGGLFWLVVAYLVPRIFTRLVFALGDLRTFWCFTGCSRLRCLRILRLSAAASVQYSGVKVAEIVMASAPAFLIERFGGINDVASFGAHMRVAVVPNLLVVSVLPVFWSHLTDRFARGNFQEVKRLYYLALGTVLLGFAGWLLCIGLASQLVNDYLFAGAIAFNWDTMGLLLAFYLIQTLALVAQTIVNSRSRFGITLRVTVSCAVACLIFSFGLRNHVTALPSVLGGFTLGWFLLGLLPGHFFVSKICRGTGAARSE